MMRFKVDENLPAEIAGILSEHGHDAQTVYEEGLTGARDEKLISVCKRESRVLVTLDIDFSDIRTYPPEQLPGCIVLRVGNQSKKHVLKVFSRVLPLIDREPLIRHVWIVEEGRVRIRGKDAE